MGLQEHEVGRKRVVLSEKDLKTWLHRNVSRLEKLLLVLSTFDQPCTLAELRERALEAGLKVRDSWAPSTILSRSKGLSIRTPSGWEITDAGCQHLRQIGVSGTSPAALVIASGLRAELAKIVNDDTRAFVEEAVKCYEAHLYRSALLSHKKYE